MKEALKSKLLRALASMSGLRYLQYEEDLYECVEKLYDQSDILQASGIRLNQYGILEWDLPVLPVLVSCYDFKKYKKKLMEFVGFDLICVDSREKGKEAVYLISLFGPEDNKDAMELLESLRSCAPSGAKSSVIISTPDPELTAVIFKLKQVWERV